MRRRSRRAARRADATKPAVDRRGHPQARRPSQPRRERARFLPLTTRRSSRLQRPPGASRILATPSLHPDRVDMDHPTTFDERLSGRRSRRRRLPDARERERVLPAGFASFSERRPRPGYHVEHSICGGRPTSRTSGRTARSSAARSGWAARTPIRCST